jgi:uncharacterized protein
MSTTVLLHQLDTGAHVSGDRAYRSKQDFMDKLIGPSMRGLHADGDMVIALFDAAATTRDGKPYKNMYSWYMRMRDDQIVEVTAFFDSVEFNEF